MGPSCIWGRVYAERLRGRLALDAGAGSDGAPRSARKASVHRLASSTSPRVIASFRAWFVAAMAGPRGLGGDASTVRSVLGAGSVIVPKSFLAVNGGGVRGVSRGGRTVESRWISLSARVNEGARFLLRPDADARFAPQTPLLSAKWDEHSLICGHGGTQFNGRARDSPACKSTDQLAIRLPAD